MTDFRPSADTLAAALKRVSNYVSYLPPSVARDVREALKEYELAVADSEIVQTPDVAKQQVRESLNRWHQNCPNCTCSFPKERE